MHKITKGLKKKKKGKKSKHKEEELFKPEELEEYRKEHQAAPSDSAEKNEEWKKFIALTSGVDDILKKTQGDLDRIKSTSFFQRKPTESEVQKSTQQQRKLAEEAREEVKKEEARQEVQLGIVEVSESESEEEDDDSIFDTAYIDAIATGEVKLAYIPESPTEKLDGDDPFDTSIAERAILGPEVQRKGKKLVPIGAAVEVLTGRVQLPTCATKRPSTSRREILKEKDLLLGSFDESSDYVKGAAPVDDAPKTLLDLDDDQIPLPNEPINLNAPPPACITNPTQTSTGKNIIEEFDVIAKKTDDPDDAEFEALAAESLAKSTKVLESLPVNTSGPIEDITWSAFDETQIPAVEVDPFDTSFAENILPGTEERIPEAELNLIKPIHRDLLGGSNTDLSVITRPNPSDQLSDEDFDPRADEQPRERAVSRPDVLNIAGAKSVSFNLTTQNFLEADNEGAKVIKPLTPFYVRKNSVPELPVEEDTSDPFDTTFASNIPPGKAELRIIETELFDPNIEKQLSLVDNDFDPRDEKKAEREKIKDITNQVKPHEKDVEIDLLAIDDNISTKVLTPGGASTQFQELSYCDPFDTSTIATNILPGKTELKILETELIQSDRNVTKPIEELLEEHHDIISHQPLSPAGGAVASTLELDPFDTSIANNIQPGKAELKLLESELI